MLAINQKKKLIEAAETIKEFCNKKVCRGSYSMCRGSYSKRCMFLVGSDCAFGEAPRNWQIPKLSRFTDEDVALAKALKVFGVEDIFKDENGAVYWLTEYRNRLLPNGTFSVIDPGKIVAVDEIIAEVEQSNG